MFQFEMLLWSCVFLEVTTFILDWIHVREANEYNIIKRLWIFTTAKTILVMFF